MTAQEIPSSRRRFLIFWGIAIVFIATVISVLRESQYYASFNQPEQFDFVSRSMYPGQWDFFSQLSSDDGKERKDHTDYDDDMESTIRDKNDIRNMTGPADKKEVTNLTPSVKECLRPRKISVSEHSCQALPTPIINLGFPKMGSSSAHAFFGCGGLTSMHYRCNYAKACGECIRDSIEAGEPPFSRCDKADAYTQIDANTKPDYSFPQIEYLEEIVLGVKKATFLLPFRNIEKWYKSVREWHMMKMRLARSNITGLPPGKGKTLKELSDWFCWHVERVRDIVKRNPRHVLVEYDIEDPSTGDFMGELFGIDSNCWGQANINTQLHPELNGTSISIPWKVKNRRGPSNQVLFNESNEREINNEIKTNAPTLTPTQSLDFSDSCFRARPDTIPTSLYNKLPRPIINLGFPKMGTTSIHAFFGCGNYSSMHYQCSPTYACGECMRWSVEEGLPPFVKCDHAPADVYAQIDYYDAKNVLHYLPQTELLEEIVHSFPNATFLLTFRSMDKWYNSVKNWYNMRPRMQMSNITGFPRCKGKNVREFSDWFCSHVRRVREIVAKNPSHSLVEIDIEDPGVGDRLSDIFGVDARCWGHANINSKIHPDLEKSNKIPWFIKDGRASGRGEQLFQFDDVIDTDKNSKFSGNNADDDGDDRGSDDDDDET